MTNEEAIKMLKSKMDGHTDTSYEWCECVRLAIKALEQQPETGEWIELEVCNCYATLKCSVCDRIINPSFTYGEYSYEDIKEWYPFCHCGADMRGEKNAK